MSIDFKARQFRRALQMFAQTITDESTMMEIADVYPKWDAYNHSYKSGEILAYGYNADGETQLYIVMQNHSSQLDWTPDVTPSLYKKVGFTPSGVPIWTQPLCAEDAYQKDDEVQHNDSIWISDYDGNVWEPGVFGWHKKVVGE